MGLIQSLTLKAGPNGSGAPLNLACGTVTLFVGPNHSGKSVLLDEIRTAMPNPQLLKATKVLAEMAFNPISPAQVASWRTEFEAAAKELGTTPQQVRVSLGGKSQVVGKEQFQQLLSAFENVETVRPLLHPWGQNAINRLSFLLNGKERLGLLAEKNRGDLRSKQGSVLGILFQNDARRTELQKIIHAAFGWYLVVDPTVENNFRAAVSPSKPASGIERSLADDALKFFNDCEAFDKMSDGVKAFCGMMATVVAHDAHVILIDEPEAFLHPAISINLAKELCRQARQRQQQLFIATHSAAFLLGCIQAGVDVNIVRLTYRQNRATSKVLAPEELTLLMRQPLLRSIGALNGLFYESVVVTEADADRAFYDEINHRCLSADDPRGIPECLFLNAQNWQTVGRIAAPLRKLGVAAAVIVDADLVQSGDNTAFQILLEALGVPGGTRGSLGQLRGKFGQRTKEQKQELKRSGVAGLQGDDKGDFENFITQLAIYGIFVVPLGELEAWLKSLNRPGWSGKPEWLISTFETMGDDAGKPGYLKPAAGDVWEFIGKVRAWLHDPNRKGMPDHPK
jgi:ABC-type cobalamin/Fe3+-siderophores transport system ATPase subunit